MEIKMTSVCAGYRGGNPPSAYLCGSALRRKLVLPTGIETIYAVFTKNRVPEAFAIKTEGGFQASLVEFRGNLTFDTRSQLGRKYKQGYRFVHIEY